MPRGVSGSTRAGGERQSRRRIGDRTWNAPPGFAAPSKPPNSAAAPATRRALGELRDTGGVDPARNDMAGFREFFERMGLEAVQDLESRYAVSDAARVGFDD